MVWTICWNNLNSGIKTMKDVYKRQGQGFSEEGGFVTRDLLYDENTNKQFITVHTLSLIHISLFAVGFQGMLILVCVAIYAVLVQGIATSGDPIGAIWGIVGYTVLLCFMLFKTGGIAQRIFGAH